MKKQNIFGLVLGVPFFLAIMFGFIGYKQLAAICLIISTVVYVVGMLIALIGGIIEWIKFGRLWGGWFVELIVLLVSIFFPPLYFASVDSEKELEDMQKKSNTRLLLEKWLNLESTKN